MEKILKVNLFYMICIIISVKFVLSEIDNSIIHKFDSMISIPIMLFFLYTIGKWLLSLVRDNSRDESRKKIYLSTALIYATLTVLESLNISQEVNYDYLKLLISIFVLVFMYYDSLKLVKVYYKILDNEFLKEDKEQMYLDAIKLAFFPINVYIVQKHLRKEIKEIRNHI